MVEDGIEHHADAMGVQRLAYGGKIGIPAQAAVDIGAGCAYRSRGYQTRAAG